MLEIINPGIEVTVQDYPGRQGYWSVGIPPSGPMDSVAFRIANRLVGNSFSEAGLEITAMGPTICFHEDAVIAMTGARCGAMLDGEALPWYTPVEVKSGMELRTGMMQQGGFRSYLAVRGGIDVPVYMGSRSTFAHGHFGGFEGRRLKKGDMLSVRKDTVCVPAKTELNISFAPVYPDHWEIGVIPGPHESPDYFTEEFTRQFYQTDYEVTVKANRLGVRLEGPKPGFSRPDGGEGGRHPSNQIDFTYAIGTINFSGDVPIIIGPDGPSLGGFVCYATIPTAELWKVGQLMPGNTIRFVKLSHGEAIERQKRLEALLNLI